MMRSYERSVTESPDRESTSRADEYTRNFMQAEALPTIWQELAFHRRFLPEITLTEVFRRASARRSDPYIDTVMRQALMEAPPRAGTIVRTTERPEAGLTEWTLSNGATVVLKPTTLRADQILFRAFAPGGTSLASDDDFPSARVADTVVPAGGVGAFSLINLEKLLSGKAIAVNPYINDTEEGMQGGS